MHPRRLLIPTFAALCSLGLGAACATTDSEPAPAPKDDPLADAVGGAAPSPSDDEAMPAPAAGPTDKAAEESKPDSPRREAEAKKSSGEDELEQADPFAAVGGSLDRDLIRRAAKTSLESGDLQRCLGAGSGVLTLELDIDPDGEVTKVAIDGATGEAVEDCVRASVETWRFPASDAGATRASLELDRTAEGLDVR